MHLGYCTNIHPGEAWDDHFRHLREQIPAVKAAVSPDAPLGLGLRVANQASIDLEQPDTLQAFQDWLAEAGCYVFTINGFPYGGFHDVRVKDHVHTPDWTSTDRVEYTNRLLRLLSKLLPDSVTEAGISTSPLSYRHWWPTAAAQQQARQRATQNVLLAVVEAMRIRQATGQVLHIDIEPEPDGLLDNLDDFLAWYANDLLPAGRTLLAERHGLSGLYAELAIRQHLRLCYDVCHMAVTYESTASALQKIDAAGVLIGKAQISSALRLDLTTDAPAKLDALRAFNEPTYLHQVVVRLADGSLTRFADLPDAFAAYDADTHREWRVHFHVPLFLENYGLLGSTQPDVIEFLQRLKTKPNAAQPEAPLPYTEQFELETYTWGVLPTAMQLPISESIARELAWVKAQL